MSYKSKHTGKEVDDAVDKIKELGTAEIATAESVSMAIANALASREKEIIAVSGSVISSLESNKIYIIGTTEGVAELSINSIATPSKNYEEYVVMNIPAEVATPSTLTLLLPDIDIKWPNGEMPELTNADFFELSIAFIRSASGSTYNAVLTKFGSV
jgi:hypothetical protein